MAMPPIRYINLDRDTERRACMEAELQRAGLRGERFPALLWTALSETEQAGFYSAALNARQHHLPLVNGEKGCYASHLQLWRWLLANRGCAVRPPSPPAAQLAPRPATPSCPAARTWAS